MTPAGSHLCCKMMTNDPLRPQRGRIFVTEIIMTLAGSHLCCKMMTNDPLRLQRGHIFVDFLFKIGHLFLAAQHDKMQAGT